LLLPGAEEQLNLPPLPLCFQRDETSGESNYLPVLSAKLKAKRPGILVWTISVAPLPRI
jgi:hypothetical protein